LCFKEVCSVLLKNKIFKSNVSVILKTNQNQLVLRVLPKN